MVLGRKLKDEKSTQRLAGMAMRLRYMKKRWAENHEQMELLRKAIGESGAGTAVAVHIMQEVKKGKRKRGYAEAEWVKAKKKVVGKQASNNMLQLAVRAGQQGVQPQQQVYPISSRGSGGRGSRCSSRCPFRSSMCRHLFREANATKARGRKEAKVGKEARVKGQDRWTSRRLAGAQC